MTRDDGAARGSGDASGNNGSEEMGAAAHRVAGDARACDLFLSYHRPDRVAVEQVRQLLEARGVATFLDRYQLVAGLPWGRALEEALRGVRGVAVFLGPSGLGTWQSREMWFALEFQAQEEATGRHFPVVPVLLPEVPTSELTSGFLFQNTWVDLRTDLTDPEALDALTRAIHGEAVLDPIGGRVAVCPYLGLGVFREQDAAFFFGRKEFADRLCEAALARNLVAIVGPSGSGKSSVVLAGLLPRLRRQQPPHETWDAVVFTPGDRPFHLLAARLVRLLEPGMSETDWQIEAQKLGDHLATGGRLEDTIARVLEKSDGTDRLLIVADQFEELFTLTPEATRAPFAMALLGALERARVTLVLTLRADFYGHAIGLSRELSDRLEQGVVNLGPMRADELELAIVEPARRVGLAFEPGLVRRILDDVAAEPGNLPLLEFALTELWGRQERGRLTHEAYDAIGGVERALTTYADEVFRRLDSDAQERAQHVFVQLVRPGEGTVDTRRQALRVEVGEQNWELVSRLATSRLVVSGRDDVTQQETVEIVHEALIGGWKQLRAWTERDRQFRMWQERLRAALRQWENSKHDEGALLRGVPLAEAGDWQRQRGSDLSEPEGRFITASLEAAQRESDARKREQAAKELRDRVIHRAVAVIAVIFMIVASIAAWQWYDAVEQRRVANQQRQIAASRALAAFAVAAVATDPELSVVLAAGAMQTMPIAQSQAALRQSLLASELRTRIAAHDGYVWSAAFDRSGQRVVTAGQDGLARVWDSEDGTPLAELRGHAGWVATAIFDGPGRRIVTAGEDQAARIWDAQSGQPLHVLVGHTAPVLSAEFSRDGQHVVTASEDGTARVWNGETGRQEQELRGRGAEVKSATFSLDGERIVTAELDNVAAIWALGSGNAPIWLEGHTGGVKMAQFDPDGNRVVTASLDKRAFVWDARTGRPLVSLIGHSDQVNSARFSPDGRLIVTASDDRTARIWDAMTGELDVELRGHNGWVRNAVFSPDGRRVVTVSWDGMARVWDVRSGDPIVELRGQYGWISSPSFNTNGSRVATAGMDGNVRIWDTGTGNLLSQLRAEADSADERWSVTRQGETVRVRAVGMEQVVAELDTAVRAAGLTPRLLTSPGGDRRVVIPSQGGAYLQDTSTNRVIVEFQGPAAHRGPVLNAAFSSTGKHLATVSDDQAARLWDPATGRSLGELRGHTAGVVLARFSSDDQFLLTASDDGTARVWDVEVAAPVAILRGLAGEIRDAAFGPDGRLVATVSADNIVSMFSCHECVAAQDLLTLARTRAHRALTTEEYGRFIQELAEQ